MRKLGSGGLILVSIILIILGFIIQSDGLVWLAKLILNVLGFGVIIVGIIVGVMGIMGLIKNRDSSY